MTENAILYLNRCVPDKHTDSCYYLDSAAILEKNLKKEQKQILELIPEVPQGRDWNNLISFRIYFNLVF